MKKSETTKEIFSALAKALGEIQGAKKDSENPFFNSMYADLESCREAMRLPFSKNGLFLTQEPFSHEGQTFISAMVTHSSGEWIEYEPLLVPIDEPNKNNEPEKQNPYDPNQKKKKNPNRAHLLKSGITYMRRAQMLAICGMAEADDDANATEPEKNPEAQGQAQNHRPVPNHAPIGNRLSEAQIKRLWAIAKANNHPNDAVFKMIRIMGEVDAPEKLNKTNYDRICDALGKKNDGEKIPF